MDEKRMIIIDGNSLVNRAYFAMQKPMMTKEGLYTHAVYGFINILSKAEKDYEPQYMAVCFDRSAPTFRHLEYDEYKAGRRKMPNELAMQLPLLKEVLAAMRIKCFEMDGFEADDLIGTIAKKAENEGLRPLVITGDRDELQLASDSVSVLITKKGISEFKIYDRAAMLEEYGLTPEQFIDLKGLMGDQSDNIPGIPGIGIKTGTKLIQEYGSVEGLLENSENIKNEKLRQKVEEGAQLALMSKRLATIDTSAPIELDFEECRLAGSDYDALVEIYTKLEFNSFLKKMKREAAASPANGEGKTAERPRAERPEVREIAGADGLFELKAALKKDRRAVLKLFSDGNHKALPKIYEMYIMVNNTVFYLTAQNFELFPEFCDILTAEEAEICGHELINDYYALLCRHKFKSGSDGRIFNTAFDTAICQYILDSGRRSYEFNALMNEYFHESIAAEAAGRGEQLALFSEDGQKREGPEYLDFFCEYAPAVLALAEAQKKLIEEEGLGEVFFGLELPLIEVLASMEAAGVAVDKAVLTEIGLSLAGSIEKLKNQIYAYAGEEFNINSPQQLGNILFEKLELPAGKKTQRGYSTDADTLERLRKLHPIIELILEYRTLSKLKNTYIEGLTPLIHEDGRIHAHFQQTVTATGRISCTEPNLQNIPVRQSLGRTIRKAFVPQAGDVFVGADYSQIELRVLAHMSGEEGLIEAFNRDEDIHRLTAARVFGMAPEEVTAAERSAAKAVNFGVIYGMSSFGLSSEIHVSRKEAERYIEDYFEKHPKVKAFMDSEIALAKEKGYVETILKRRRYIPEMKSSAYTVRQLGERLAMNTPIQGSAADIIKIAMLRVYARLKKEGLKAGLILQIHDELILEVAEEERAAAESLLREEMEGAMSFSVKLTAELNSARNWYELK